MAATNIQDAVRAASAGDVVLLTDGVYRLAQEIVVSNGMRITSVNGMAATVVDGQNRCRCFVNNAATIEGLTITAGTADNGGGVFSTQGTVAWCRVTNCGTAMTTGGGVYGGTVVHCILENNVAYWGGGVAQADMVDACVVRGNYAGKFGAGVYGGLVRNSLLVGNWLPRTSWPPSTFGGGAYGAVVENCTVAGNSAEDGGGLAGCSAVNTIIVGNTGNDTNVFGQPMYNPPPPCTLVYCWHGLPAGFVDSTNSNYRLSASSPCRNAGTYRPWMDTSMDLDGLPRIYTTVDIGAYELTGPFIANLTASTTAGLAPLTVTFRAQVCGSNTAPVRCYWDFDATGLADCRTNAGDVVTWVYAQTGSYSVALSVSNLVGESVNLIHTNYIKVIDRVTAAFAALPVTGPAPLRVYFHDLSENALQYWAWDFDGNGSVDSTLRNPSHFYMTAGIYSVTLTVSNNFGAAGALAATLTKTNCVLVQGAQAEADFTVDRTVVQLGEPVCFSDRSRNNPEERHWNFGLDGDGDVTAASPTATYYKAGLKTVALTIVFHDGWRSVSVVKSNLVDVTDPYGITRVHYVARDGSNRVPFQTWAGAAHEVQAALNAADPGDFVAVAAGAYAPIHVGATVTVYGVGGPRVTVINGGGQQRCAYLQPGAVLQGFTLSNGYASSGAGVYCAGAAEVRDCVIAECRARNQYDVADGAGLYGGTAYNCIVTGNLAYAYGSKARGAGLYGATAYNCLVVGNRADGYVYTGPSQDLCIGGGACSAILVNCTVVGNEARGIVEDRWAYTYEAGWGGGAADSTAHNCVVAGNAAPSSTNLYRSTADFTCTIGPVPGLSNIYAAPGFAGGYHLAATSPCIDAAQSAVWMTDACDLDGNERTCGSAVDMGAFEFSTVAWCNVTAVPRVACVDEPVFFRAWTSLNTPALWYRWTLAEPQWGTISTLADTIATNYAVEGPYSIRLAVGSATTNLVTRVKYFYITIVPEPMSGMVVLILCMLAHGRPRAHDSRMPRPPRSLY
ncbi:MAG: PKD domain-containing protein [bacterium]|nr:PKD domain-containing protein [bacterium]